MSSFCPNFCETFIYLFKNVDIHIYVSRLILEMMYVEHRTYHRYNNDNVIYLIVTQAHEKDKKLVRMEKF